MEEAINKICELLENIVNQNSGINWNMISAIGEWVTPIATTILSYYLGRKIEKQKNIVSQANSATLNLIKESRIGNNQDNLKNNILDYIKACIMVNTIQVVDYFNITDDEALKCLKELQQDKQVEVIRINEEQNKWIWRAI